MRLGWRIGIATVALSLAPFAGAGAATTTTAKATTTTTTATASGPALPSTPPPVAWILVDADTGHVLDGKDVHTAYRPASIVKVMTALAALERMPPDAKVSISQNAVDHGLSNQNPSGMKVGQTWTVKDVVALMMIISTNDGAYALAETTSGSVAKFAGDEMATARALGMRDSTFNDPAGLDDGTSYGGGPKMSAYDIAIAVRDALHVPTIAGPARTATYDFTDPSGAQHHVTNHNQMLPGLGASAYQDATGFKTGSTQLAGNTLAATATRNGRTLIAIILNCFDRYNWAKAFFERGFNTPVGTAGNGVALPAVQDLTYAHRADVKAAAVRFLTGTRGLGSATTLPGATITTYRPVSTTVAKPKTTKQVVVHKTTAAKRGSGGGVSGFQIALLVIAVLLATVVLLRRRAVRRQRARREARRRAQKALRSGALPVVDGRYRAGMRTGRSPQSNVRVHRDRD